MKVIFRMAFLGALVAIVVFLANMDPKLPEQVAHDAAARRWVQENLPDRDAALLGFSEERNLWDQRYRMGWIRAKNTYGVSVVSNVVFEMEDGKEMLRAWRAGDFVRSKVHELGGMSPSMQGQRAAELQRFCKEMEIPPDKDS